LDFDDEGKVVLPSHQEIVQKCSQTVLNFSKDGIFYKLIVCCLASVDDISQKPKGMGDIDTMRAQGLISPLHYDFLAYIAQHIGATHT
jgi:hypothetical protein